MTQEEIEALVARWLKEELDADLRRRLDPGAAGDGSDPRFDAAWDAELALDHWLDVARRHDWAEGELLTRSLVQRYGLRIEPGSPEHNLIRMLLCLASVELHSIKSERWRGRFASKPELFPLRQGAATEPVSSPAPATPTHVSLKAAIEQFLGERRRLGEVKPKRLMDYEAALRVLETHFGPDTPVGSIRKQQLGEVRQLLTKLPPNYSKLFRGLGLAEIARTAEERGLPSLAPQTINTKYLAIYDAFFEWAVSCGYAAENPAHGVRISKAKRRNSYGTFTVAQLNAIVKAPLYTGCLSETHIYEPGSCRVRDHRFWLPLIGMFTGARLNELCQLRLEDVKVVDGIWCFWIAGEGDKTVKTDAANRLVPLHPELHRLGLVDYVEALRRRGEKQLFPEIEKGAGGYASDKPTKWFARFLRKTLGAETVEREHLVFHSFRHTVKDAMREAGIDERMQDALIGHENKHVSSVYGKGYGARRRFEELSKICYRGLELDHLILRTARAA